MGYWTQHFQYAAAKASGKTAFGSAKTPDQLADVIRNTFIQGTLSVIFAAVVVIVLVAAIIVIFKVIRGGGMPLTEDDPVPSRMFAPSGMIATCGRTGGTTPMGRVLRPAQLAGEHRSSRVDRIHSRRVIRASTKRPLYLVKAIAPQHFWRIVW